MTPSELRLVLADALDGAAERLRAGIIPATGPERVADDPSTREPFPEITKHVLKVEDVAKLLRLSTWKVYESIRLGEIPSIHVGWPVLIPTHALRDWLTNAPDWSSGKISNAHRTRHSRLEPS